jgi:hypothetical protein
MRPARDFTNWLNSGFPAPLHKNILQCSTQIADELIAALDFYAEIKQSGKSILRAKGHTNLAEAYTQFRAYIRQAKTFYEGAEALHHRASPLNYYYSFMNLAKALLLLNSPGFVDRGLTHGISPQSAIGSLKKQKIIVRPHGIFPLFYKLVWPAPGSEDTELGVLMEREVRHGAAEVHARVQA